MSTEQIENIYYTLIGVMNEAYCVEGVENEDTDVETIIRSLMDIEKTVSIKMFEYGMRFAMQEK